jgi:hypothetical protein
MTVRRDGHYPLEPRTRLGDFRLLHSTNWGDIDRKASDLLGKKCLGIPSLRVGLCWTLEYLGYNRHRDHVLVPKFMGRCILNSLNRYAFPLEEITSHTRLAIVVHQYGLKQRLDLIGEECDSKGLIYVEDSPCGLEQNEDQGPGSLAKFIGLSKILPVLKGALAVSRDQGLLEFFRTKRKEASLWSWAVLGAMASLRRRRKVRGYSALATAAYEMYPECKGDNAWFRGNILCVLEELDSFATQASLRLSMIEDRIKEWVLIPDSERLAYVVPYFPNENSARAQEAFAQFGFDATLFHIDVARNLFRPRYKKAHLIPLNPRIPIKHFQNLVDGLATLSN